MRKTLIFGLIFLISLVGVSAISDYCGDGVCANYEYYNETNPANAYYCPSDCGILATEAWCRSHYSLLIPTECPATSCPCPPCGGCSCDISRISSTELNNFCLTHGYSISGSQSLLSPTSSSLTNNWLIFLIIGAAIGYFIAKKRR
jgi:hypothetical protein